MVMVPPTGMRLTGVNTMLTTPVVALFPTLSDATRVRGFPTYVKKPDGYVSVIMLPAASAPPAVVVNENVAAADALPATRSDAAIANEVLVT
jgi:hypothetical protein